VITAAHNDLSMWNVVVANDRRIGVVDWEAASTCSLPLLDFYYAAVDATAATRGYADRLRAFASVFGDGGVPSGKTAELESIILKGLGVDRTSARLAFHACWLHHAVNELQRTSGVQPGPFVRIVQSIAGSE
jgi:aminoglycoside phosphotransferase (APT) family kinase protein